MWAVDSLCRLVLFLASALVLFIALSFAVVGWGNRTAKKNGQRKYPRHPSCGGATFTDGKRVEWSTDPADFTTDPR